MRWRLLAAVLAMLAQASLVMQAAGAVEWCRDGHAGGHAGAGVGHAEWVWACPNQPGEHEASAAGVAGADRPTGEPDRPADQGDQIGEAGCSHSDAHGDGRSSGQRQRTLPTTLWWTGWMWPAARTEAPTAARSRAEGRCWSGDGPGLAGVVVLRV